MKKLEKGELGCYFDLTLSLMGGKWKPMILFYVGTLEILRYSELKRIIPRINERMLTRQLRELEDDGLVKRKIYPVIPPKVEYSLTPKGNSLLPVLHILKNWGRDQAREEMKELNERFEEVENSCANMIENHSFLKKGDILIPKLDRLIKELRN